MRMQPGTRSHHLAGFAESGRVLCSFRVQLKAVLGGRLSPCPPSGEKRVASTSWQVKDKVYCKRRAGGTDGQGREKGVKTG